ncbi:MAG: TlpA family protein disulfide reductase [Actinomycetota bacterium]|nr:TlpA family protein disulfide reductase [Actinomycetota bacterium]
MVSLAIPAGGLALILRAYRTPAADTTTNGTAVTPEKAKIGSLAPDFTLPGLDGKPVTLSGLRGRVVVLTFFASWCHPCEQDMPILERALRDTGDRIAIVGVNYRDFPNDSRDFVRRLGVTFPVLIEDSTDNPVAARYDVHAMPDTLFIDANGRVRERLFGQTSRHDLESALNALLRD